MDSDVISDKLCVVVSGQVCYQLWGKPVKLRPANDVHVHRHTPLRDRCKLYILIQPDPPLVIAAFSLRQPRFWSYFHQSLKQSQLFELRMIREPLNSLHTAADSRVVLIEVFLGIL